MTGPSSRVAQLVAAHFVSGFVAERNTPTQDAYGDPIEGWATVATFDGRLRPFSGDRRFDAETYGFEGDHVLYAPPGTTVANGDRVQYDGRTFNVVEVRDVQDEGSYLRIGLEELT